MMKVRSGSNKRGEQQTPLLMEVDASDQEPSEYAETFRFDEDDPRLGGGKKKGWRKRLFGGKKAARRKNELHQAPSISKSSSSQTADLPPLLVRQQEKPQDDEETTQSTNQSNNHQELRQQQEPPKVYSSPMRTPNSPRKERPPAADASRSVYNQPVEPTRNTYHQQPVDTSRNTYSQQQPVETSRNIRPKPNHQQPVVQTSRNLYQQQELPFVDSSRAPSDSVAGILQRPFGRDAMPAEELRWAVQVAPAEWDTEESSWKYRITISRRDTDGKVTEYVSGFTLRSLADFHWLEKSLLQEFNGGLLLPSLSIALGVPNLTTCQHEVDNRLFANWLSDVVNGVRGQGELILSNDRFEVLNSESMEAFLYQTELMPGSPSPRATGMCAPQEAVIDPYHEKENSMWNFIELCGTTGTLVDPITTPAKRKNPLQKLNCSSAALGGARSFDVQQDSFVEAPTFDTATTTAHSELLQAEKELTWAWRSRGLLAMEKIRVLQEQEKQIGAAWRRFSIAVSNLFGYEKDVEAAKLGNGTRKDLQLPYRKLHKSAVEECLRLMATRKVERSTPSLERLNFMLSAYVADLSSVEPSIQAYLEGLQQLEKTRNNAEIVNGSTMPVQEPPTSLADQIQAGLMEVKKQLAATKNDGRPKSQEESIRQQQLDHFRTLESRTMMNEVLLRDNLTLVCKTAPVRTARMLYNFFSVELSQCAAVHGAALNMKSKINVASKETLSRMIHRHHVEIKEDRATEIQLVQRIVHITNAKKYPKENGDETTEEIERGVEINKDIENEEAEKAKLRDKALNLCRARIGRWDAKLAMSIMDAVGVKDANVRVEETTRDLRLVRKYAIGLRENVQRCADALVVLRQAVAQGGNGDIRDIRYHFMREMQNLLSATYMPLEDKAKPISVRALLMAGIDLSDPAGWRSLDSGTCGGALKAYLDAREASTEWLLDSLGELLKEYMERVEAVESFVYMECVGIQLEKHFSQARATALSAFEKKTDITSAINIATRKRMPVLVRELQAKLASVGADVSHTTVKEAKEAHLESKALKQELNTLAMRRLTRSRETSTERVIALLTIWSREEESSSSNQMKILTSLQKSLEVSIGLEELDAYADATPTARNGGRLYTC